MAKKKEKSVASFNFHPFSKVVSAKEMSRVERLSILQGEDEEKYMEEAGRKIANAAIDWVQEKKLPKKVCLLIGKGNNGGDAFVAGIFLMEVGFKVRAVTLYPREVCSKLNQKNWRAFTKMGGKIEPFDREMSFEKEGLLLDGLLGTGFKGKLDKNIKAVIDLANGSKRPILAIDIPSGLDGTTGESKGGISATLTVSLGLAKQGFFLKDGWNCVGDLRVENFGLPLKFAEIAAPFAFLPSKKNMGELLPPVLRVRHKYQAGYVVGFAGSDQFKGAPKMSGLAALRSGAGIVRVFHREEIGEAPPELICERWEEKKWEKELKRAKALFIGPGLGDTAEAISWLKKELKKIKLPLVLDADALQKGLTFPKNTILTPHRGEMLRLLGLKKGLEEEALLEKCQKFTNKNKVILVLKGAPTFIFSAKNSPVIIPYGDPGMATAGSGDVLTGAIAALLAQGLEPFEAAVLGALLHSLAGEEGAKLKTSYGEIAGDLVELMPKAFQIVLEWREG